MAAEGAEQGLLFTAMPGDTERSNRLMDCLDKINRARGRGAVHYAAEGLGERWRMRQKLKSAASTTGWAGVPAVRAGSSCTPRLVMTSVLAFAKGS